jgi:hypothetical protein
MDSTEWENSSLLQFVHWPLFMGHGFVVPVLPVMGGFDCRIFSPWIDLEFKRTPVPQIRGIVRWNERQFLADQSVLSGGRDVPQNVIMPLTYREFLHFASEYEFTELWKRPAARPIEELVPRDILWLFRHTGFNDRAGPFDVSASGTIDKVVKKGAEGYTKLVFALIDHCFASVGANIHYNSILDAADLIPLGQYKIDMPVRRGR